MLAFWTDTDCHSHSVCAITTIRVILASQLKLDDYTDGIARIGIVTTLEPLLGIIVACLPIFPPTLKAILGHVKRASPETHNTLSSSIARLRLKRSKGSPFERFDDYLLTDLENQRVEQTITGPTKKLDSSVRGSDQPADPDGLEVPPLNSIIIRHDWEIRSESARHSKAQLQLENNMF